MPGAWDLLVLFGIIGGILVTSGVFLPWVEGWKVFSGWDLITEISLLRYIGVLLLLIGGIVVLFGGIILAFKVKSAAYLILIGGILAIFGMNINVWWSDMLYGYYMCLVGSILGVISGIMGLLLRT